MDGNETIMYGVASGRSVSTGKGQPSDSAEARFMLRNVSFALGDKKLLADVTLALPSRQVIGLIGHNGSGKSTLIKILARQQPASAGTVDFENRPLGAWQTREFAQRVAFLPQSPPSADGITVRELVAYGRYPWHGALGRYGAKDRELIQNAMELTGVESFADRFVATLSGGERQRVWLSMLIAQDADYLLLDEPTSALDIAHQFEVLSLVRQLAKQRGLGVFVVLHDVNMAARFCDEIVALKGGRVIARGAPEQIMTPEQLHAIYDIRMGVMRPSDTSGPVSYVA